MCLVSCVRARARARQNFQYISKNLKVGSQNEAKTLKVSTWPDGAKTLKVPGRSETVPRDYDVSASRPWDWDQNLTNGGNRTLLNMLCNRTDTFGRDVAYSCTLTSASVSASGGGHQGDP
jgi:hypothetical protein